MTKRIGILTSGGDCAGLNAVIRGVALRAHHGHGWTTVGIRNGTLGLLERPVGARELDPARLDAAQARQGGTFLGSTNKGDPFAFPMPDGSRRDRSAEMGDGIRALGLDGLIGVGGDGSLDILRRLFQPTGIPFIGVPKTIDNDVAGTITTFGFDTAVNTALEAIDKLHTTAESHDRVIVIEVMGRGAGFIALHAGLAGTADVILIPEIPFELAKVCEKIAARDRAGRHFSIVVVAEGAIPKGGTESIMGPSLPGQDRRVGGICGRLAFEIQKITGKETRSLVLGHLQRGGVPTGYDRLLATRFGGAAVRAIEGRKWGHMVALQSPHIVTIPMKEALREAKRVETTHDVVRTARETGISFGD
jgi:phosphofructokinase-like protein